MYYLPVRTFRGQKYFSSHNRKCEKPSGIPIFLDLSVYCVVFKQNIGHENNF